MQDLFLMLYWELLPTLLQVIGAILGILLMRAANTAKTRWGIEIEARHREALHSALMSGIRAALSRGVSGQDAIREAIRHAGNSVPDAISALKPGSGVLASIAEAKLREALDFTALPLDLPDEVIAAANRVQTDPRAYGPSGGAVVMATIQDALRKQGQTDEAAR